MTWQAKSGCAEHHRAAVERIANSFPVPWLLAPRTYEAFDCNRRLRARDFVEGFGIVRMEAPRPALATDLGAFFMVKPQFRKKKTHGVVDARDLSGWRLLA